MDNKTLMDIMPASSRRFGGENPARRLAARGWQEGDEATEPMREVMPTADTSPVLLLASAGGDAVGSVSVVPAAEDSSPPVTARTGWTLAGGAVMFGALASATRKEDDSIAVSTPADQTAPTATVSHPGDSTLVLELLNFSSVRAGRGPLVDVPYSGINILIGGMPVRLASADIDHAGQRTVIRTPSSDLADYSTLAEAFAVSLAKAAYDGNTHGKPMVTVRVGNTFDTVDHLTGVPITGIGYQLVFTSEGSQDLSVDPYGGVWQVDAAVPAIASSHQRVFPQQAAFTGPVPFTISFDEPVSGLTLDDLSVSGGSKLALSGTGTSYTLTVMPNANTQGTLSVHLPAGAVHDAAGNGNTTAIEESVLFDTRNATYAPGQPMIDLGAYGRLIAPVQSDGGAWYYYWDRSGDGSGADQGLLNGGHDAVTHDELDALFVLDAAGQIGGGINTSEAIRYASLNGVKLALPTANGGAPLPAGIGHPQPGTEVDNRPAGEPNVTYNDLLGLWDGQNGGTTATGQSGAPAGWAGGLYWSATASANGHLGVDLLTGTVFDDIDARTAHVAVWVV